MADLWGGQKVAESGDHGPHCQNEDGDSQNQADIKTPPEIPYLCIVLIFIAIAPMVSRIPFECHATLPAVSRFVRFHSGTHRAVILGTGRRLYGFMSMAMPMVFMLVPLVVVMVVAATAGLRFSHGVLSPFSLRALP